MIRKILLTGIAMLVVMSNFAQSTRKEMPFGKYNFIRNSYREQNLEFLMGNGEMGALADKKGLGFEKLWFTDLWANKEWRKSLEGPVLFNADYINRDFQDASFHQELNIKNGILGTSVCFGDGRGYETKIFFQKRNLHVLVMQVKNTSERGKDDWELKVPFADFNLAQKNNHQVDATMKADTFYTRVAWSVRSDKEFRLKDGHIVFQLNPNESATFLYAVATHWDGPDFCNRVQNAVLQTPSILGLEKDQVKEWNKHWAGLASVILPDGDYAKWFYRSIFTLYATSGDGKFTAGEEMFSIPDPDWHMHAFTYGHGGGWSVWAFALLGDKERAMNVAKCLYKPQALKGNVRILFPRTGPVELVYKNKSKGMVTYLDEYNPNALAFGHEVDTEGHDIPYSTTSHWDLQRHIDGYAAAFYHLLNRYYPEKQFNDQVAYPVLRGTAEMYAGLVKWDSIRNFYFLPPLLSVSENIMEKSVLDAVLSVRWNLNMASDYAEKMGTDAGLSQKWRSIASKLYIPQNDTTYLEYLDDRMTRKGGGYFGIRAFQYLGYPYCEQIKDIDPKKAQNSIDRSWRANQGGKGMITFITNWFALTESYLGHGQKAYDMSKLVLANSDSSDACLCEAISTDDKGKEFCTNKYFLTGYDSFILVPLTMCLQSYECVIKLFPAMPKEFSNFEIYDLPAEADIKVSALYKNGKIEWVDFANRNSHRHIDSGVKNSYRISEIFEGK